MKLCINTLGEFDIKLNGQSILRQASRTYKLNKLFEYFLTFRNKKLLPDTIIENLLSDSESNDPKNTLRTQIFRLRKFLKSMLPEDACESTYFNISFTNGYYILELGKNSVVDIDEFERLIQQAGSEVDNINSSIELYEEALEIYKGLYLSDNAYEVWLVPTRNFYQRLYQKTLLKLINIFKDRNEYEKIISLCEKALLIEPYDEYIHENLMESMINLGQIKVALNHYDYALKLIEKEMDAKPSARFISFLGKIQNRANSIENDIDINSIKEKLDDGNFYGAMQCNPEYFKVLYNLQKRKAHRSKKQDYLCIISVNYDKGYDYVTCLNDWSKLVEFSLRKGDVYTIWNNNQILILLHDVLEEGTKYIEDRLNQNLKGHTNINNDKAKIVFQPLFKENHTY